jgi:hypothetical protein
MKKTGKPQRNVPGGNHASGQSRPDRPRKKPGAPAAANLPGKKPAPPSSPSPNKRDDQKPLRDDEDTLEDYMDDDDDDEE